MLGFLKWLGIIIVVLALGIAVFLFGMRFHDGPLEIVTGGPQAWLNAVDCNKGPFGSLN